MVLLNHELRINLKSVLLWTVCVGFTCFGCIWLFGGLAESMEQMAQAYAEMGAFSTALGLDRISVSTMEGFYATEVALIYAIGGAMFAAMTGACMLAKEEEGHTSEFLNTLPLGRGYIVLWKLLSMAVLILLFNAFCILPDLRWPWRLCRRERRYRERRSFLQRSLSGIWRCFTQPSF